jgi:spore coat protein U-like protein
MSRQRANVKIARPNGVVQRVNCCFLTINLFAIATFTFGQQTASITLSGTVNRIAAITVTPQNNYNSLDLVNGENQKTVAIVNERSNDKAGYTVTLTSIGAAGTSQAQLRPVTPGNPDTIPYFLKYGGATVTLNQGTATVTAAGGRTSSVGANNVLAVTIPSSAGVTADTYSDTLQLTIQGN